MSGSWFIVAECELSVHTNQCLARCIESEAILRTEAAAWSNHRNDKQAVDWQFTAVNAWIKLKRFYPQTLNG